MTAREFAIAGVLAGALACSSVRPVSEPARFLTEKKPPVVFVSYVSEGVGFTREMANPRIDGDSVFGTWTEGNRPAALPMKDVHSIATARRDGARTALLFAGIAAATGLAAYSFYNGAGGRADWFCDYSPNRRGPAGEPYCGPKEPGSP